MDCKNLSCSPQHKQGLSLSYRTMMDHKLQCTLSTWFFLSTYAYIRIYIYIYIIFWISSPPSGKKDCFPYWFISDGKNDIFFHKRNLKIQGLLRSLTPCPIYSMPGNKARCMPLPRLKSIAPVVHHAERLLFKGDTQLWFIKCESFTPRMPRDIGMIWGALMEKWTE